MADTRSRKESDVAAHYDTLLARHYDWMLGNLGSVVEAETDLLRTLTGGMASSRRTGLDLGCGTGVHTLALAALGFGPITCIDASITMLDILRDHTRDVVATTTVRADLTSGLGAHVPAGSVGAAVCMGDTLTHLPDVKAIAALFEEVRTALTVDGWFAMSFRDLTAAPIGTARFIPVRSDPNTIMTCVLEDEGTHIRVHDLIHRRSESGGWEQSVSSYRKLKLSAASALNLLADAGFAASAVEVTPRGLSVIVARP
jgi:SAM-dependent methyltransferase